MTHGGPPDSTQVIALMVYKPRFKFTLWTGVCYRANSIRRRGSFDHLQRVQKSDWVLAKPCFSRCVECTCGIIHPGLLALQCSCRLFSMVSTSFKLRGEIEFPPMLLPKTFTLANYFNVSASGSRASPIKTLRLSLLRKHCFRVATSALLGYVFGKFQFVSGSYLLRNAASTVILPLEVYVIPSVK